MPAANPYVIAVGAADTNGTDARTDDTVADFSSRGNATRHADVLAPAGRWCRCASPARTSTPPTRAAGSPAPPPQRFFRGSGTSQATAVVSGAAALLLQQRPKLTPDQVKALLTSTSAKLNVTKAPLNTNISAEGAGEMDLQKALEAPTPAGVQTWAAADGTGSLEASRGTAFVADPTNGVELHGEQDIMGRNWNTRSISTQESDGTVWSGGTFNGRTWAGTARTANAWAPVAWTGGTWSGSTWSGRTWSGATWSGATWSGRTWSGRTWSGRTWSGDYWSTSRWR